MARDRYDDELDDEEPGPEAETKFPGIVMLAGIIWIGVGVLGIINVIVSLALAGAQAAQGGPAAGGSPCCGVFIALAFLYSGFQTVTGKAADTLGNAIGSLALGLLQILLAAAIGFGGMFLGRNPGAAPQPGLAEVILIVATLLGIMGTTLVAAGILALVGRRRYREWREAAAPPPRRRRSRPRPDEPDDLDE